PSTRSPPPVPALSPKRLDSVSPELCYTSWDITITTDLGIDARRDVFIFVEDRCEVRIEPIEVA
ncbi:MAG TPA: hypothetical protein VLW86_09980, partial [Syntrophorhabdales bacterium]|nr:hypothetical protein [Syntrophorhabdales bacterium]